MATVGFSLLELAAWFGAFFGPMMLAAWFWIVVAERYPKWAAHLLFAPSVIALEWTMIWLICFAEHDDGEGPPGLGIALLFPLGVFLGTITVYYLGAGWTVVRSFWVGLKVR